MKKKVIPMIPILLLFIVMGIAGIKKGIENKETWRIVGTVVVFVLFILIFVLIWTTNIFDRKNN